MEPDVEGVAQNELGGQKGTELLIELTYAPLIKLA